MKTQTPLYRAKKRDSDEYVEGNLISDGDDFYLSKINTVYMMKDDGHSDNRLELILGISFEIDPSTLSIHFPDMLASDSDRLLPNGEKDLRIFASLSEDGKGGDTIFHKGDFCLESKNDLIAIYKNGSFRMTPPDFCTSFKLIEWVGFTTKITGIKQ